MSENLAVQGFGYLKRRFQNKITPLHTENFVLLYLPKLGHRYIYQILHYFSSSPSQIVFIWNFNLENYIKLTHEGRRLFTIKNLKIVSTPSCGLKPKAIVSSEKDEIGAFDKVPVQIKIETDVSIPVDKGEGDTFMLPYGIHPFLLQNYDQFSQEIQKFRDQERHISIFFAGNTRYEETRYLIEQSYHVPSRDRCVEFLLENSSQLKIVEIRNFKQRQQILAQAKQYQAYSVVLCTSKGLAENWLRELAIADFFLALPGWYMLMCHNAIEAMAVGCIPILSYENWFSPALVHGKNCFVYKQLEDLPKLISHINHMSKEEISEMRAAVINYFDCYLNPSKIAAFLLQYQGSKLHLYINNEDSKTLRNVNNSSILCRGGSLQSLLETM